MYQAFLMHTEKYYHQAEIHQPSDSTFLFDIKNHTVFIYMVNPNRPAAALRL